MTKKVELQSDAKITAEQKEMIGQLSAESLALIDRALLSNASTQWSHTDRIVLATMIELDNGLGLPTTYFVERVGHLVQGGLLESKGDLPCTRSSEVRLKS
jgi:hypothetical protein